MATVHHSAICTRDIDESLQFWRDGLGFKVLMDERFEGDWPTLLRAPTTALRSVFLGDTDAPDAGIVELVDLGEVPDGDRTGEAPASAGFLLLSIMTDVEVVLARLRELEVGGIPRRTEVRGVAMAVVIDPNGVWVELIDTAASHNLERLAVNGDGA